ncbi:MAG TPA: SPOR domain-containing protein [Gemmatimonadales bacterium]|nr:SPOR domain-containing protein [Gemmatimonadales bacterium]
MTGRALPRSRLDALIPSLVAGQGLVSLVPATGDLAWAAGAAWDVARAAAKSGERRVALVDLWLEHPALHTVVGLDPTEGIVDAFEYDVSLTKATREVDGVFFIGAGTVTTHAGDLFTNPRWRRLHGGFRSEDALLLLYLSAGALARLSTVPDGLIVLSADGYELESSIGQGIAAATERGVPLLGVVRERWSGVVVPPPGQVSARGRSGTPGARAGLSGNSRRARPVVLGVTLAAGTALGWVLLARGAEHRVAEGGSAGAGATRPGPSASSAPSAPAVRAASGGSTPAGTPSAPTAAPALAVASASRGESAGKAAGQRDSLPWTVQLAAYARLDRALVLAGRLSADGVTPFVTPVTLGPRGGGTVWYRVLAGGFRTRDAAVSARGTLWDHGLARRGQGDVLRAPYSYALTGAASVDDLRSRGIPATARDGDGRLLAGAFETPEQASVLEARLKRAGVRGKLVTRMGTTP